MEKALHAEVNARHAEFIEGLRAYIRHPYCRTEDTSAQEIWRSGSTVLREYPTHNKLSRQTPTVLLIPSLINRAYILDLSPQRSMARFLASRGIRTLLLDWQDPGEREKAFGIDDYVTERLLPALSAANAEGEKVILAGYCMGGLLALAAAQLAPQHVSGLALLATPWDFHSADAPRLPSDLSFTTWMQQAIDAQPFVPGALVYQWFYLMHPWAVHAKYRKFSALDPASAAALSFVEREAWLHDGVAMTQNVARTCFLEWPLHNMPARGMWKIDGEIIRPEQYSLPTFVAIPSADKVVPPQCASAVCSALRRPHIVRPAAGHIGMIAGARSREELWEPLAKWVGSL